MTSEQLHDALTLLPEDLVARADEFRSRRPKSIPFRRYAALAAVFAVMVTSAMMVHTLRRKSAPSEMAAASYAMLDTGAVAAEAPRMEAAKGSPETSGSTAMADSAIPFTCVETPVNVHSTASFDHGPAATGITSREELDAYLSKWDRLYLLDTLRDTCQIYDEGWFSSHDLLLIPADGVTGPCAVTDLAIADGVCEVTITIDGEETENLTNYHILLPVEKGSVTDTQNITVIYISDTNG